MLNNPINQIISDEAFSALMQCGLLNRKMLRDIEIKRRYLNLRSMRVKSSDAIERIIEEFPDLHLEFDTIRKIVYSVKLPESLINPMIDRDPPQMSIHRGCA